MVADRDYSSWQEDDESVSPERVRQRILEMGRALGGAHYGGCLSCVEILIAIYSCIDGVGVRTSSPERDFVILGKGHAALALYAVLEESFGWKFDNRNNVSSLSCHPDYNPSRGIEITGGALGHALAIGCGRAMWAELKGVETRSYVVLGDGECQEGSVWEAALFAGHRKLKRLTVVIDRNGFQSRAATTDRAHCSTIPDAWTAIGWSTRIVDGHDLSALAFALSADRLTDAPLVIFADTAKGRGVSFLEGKLASHYCTLPDDVWAVAFAELGGVRI